MKILFQKIIKSSGFQKILNFCLSKSKEELLIYINGMNSPSKYLLLELLKDKTSHNYIIINKFNKLIVKYLGTIILSSKIIYFKELVNLIENFHFSKTEKVIQKGEYSQKGDTITFWPIEYQHPIRAVFWGEKADYFEVYDEIYGNQIIHIENFIIGDLGLLDLRYDSDLIYVTDFKNNSGKIKPISLSPKIIFSNDQISKKNNFNHIVFDFVYPSLFFKRLDIFYKEIDKRLEEGWIIYISSRHINQLSNKYQKLKIIEAFETGFESSKLKIAVYTDREIFGTIFIRNERLRQKSIKQKEINRYLSQLEGEIEVNDYIVHEDYGVAVYRGIKQQKSLGELKEFLELEYDKKDRLYVPITQIFKLTKYIGPDNVLPQITRLGRGEWNRIKLKVKKSVGFIAKELIRIYALRELAKGFSFSFHEWEDKFASDFEFEETEDQKRVICEVLKDMESGKSMDRLLVGDVGFGKTEVALRAMFRAVMNDKQVVMLCPTTILVSQHYYVLKHRMRNFPINIKTLSRFGTKGQNKIIIDELSSGKVDIVIGTHRLLSNDVKFKSLGLLVLDEEQRFGVKQKEKIKKMSYGIDVLTMSATPIPRTLSMALSGIRDISLITTPPPGRKSIKTFVEKFDWNEVCKTIVDEKNRGGQIYFLHNEVRTIESIKIKLQKLLPEIRFEIAHGQMHPMTLDKIMRKFYENKFDCLICTTIIENGIDIKNVNTIIINKSQNFGLAQLYQLRGRVGRGKEQAYCYLFYTGRNPISLKKSPNLEEIDEEIDENSKYIKKPNIKSLDKWKERLQAMLESQELGSGFKIASRDLEIRGAGNLLGAEQHGNINAVGFGLYTQLLAEEIEKLKEKNSLL